MIRTFFKITSAITRFTASPILMPPEGKGEKLSYFSTLLRLPRGVVVYNIYIQTLGGLYE